MSPDSIYLAIDLGAGSGRVMAGLMKADKMALEEVNRFENKVIEEDGKLSWDFEGLWEGILDGLTRAAAQYGAERITSLGVDTWGVDYGLLDGEENLLARPRCHRDPRTGGMMAKFFERLSAGDLFRETGIQFLDINTLPQLCAEVAEESPAWRAAERFLLMPDLVNLRLSGRAACERTNASTTQMYDPARKMWSRRVFDAAGVPLSRAPGFVEAGADMGTILPAVAERTGLRPTTRVVAVGSHDTASAVAAVPAGEGQRFAYLSSGTWSLLGAELAAPVLTPLAQRYNFTNEVGVFDTVRLLKNINGMWLVQECRRVWAEMGKNWSYQELTMMASEAESLRALIDPDDPRFRGRCDMPAEIAAFCQEGGQPVPESPGEVMRVVMDSLAMKVRYVLNCLEELTGEKVEVLHIIGGGGRNAELNQSIANSINRPVRVGPYEATAAGNILMQHYAAGGIASLEEGRAMIRRSFETESNHPGNAPEWQRAFERYSAIIP